MSPLLSFFFFQAEDGIRDLTVTGVQTCALPISRVMTLTSTYDHRVIQGAESGMFLRKLDAVLQGEERFYEVVAETLAITGLGARGSGGGETTARALPGPQPPNPSPHLKHRAAAVALVKAFRNFGPMAPRLHPL